MGLQETQSASSLCSENSTSCYSTKSNLPTKALALNGVVTVQKFSNTSLIIETGVEKQRELETRRLWRNANAVCFDVDSTVCQNEAIDDIAEFLGVSEEVAQCTRDAMTGQMTFREALRRRLDLMRPSSKQLNNYLANHKIRLTPGIVELVGELHRQNIDVYLVSGGFRSVIRPVAELLNISPKNIFANEIQFNENGSYAGFDETELTSDSGSKQVGKAGVCALLKARSGYKTLIMVGDGATDAEASPPADAFIGFGGNQIREAVKKLSDWYVYDFQTLYNELRNAQ